MINTQEREKEATMRWYVLEGITAAAMGGGLLSASAIAEMIGRAPITEPFGPVTWAVFAIGFVAAAFCRTKARPVG